MNGWMMVEPADMPSDTVQLDLNLSNMLLCDKPFRGSPTFRQGALDGIEMAGALIELARHNQACVVASLIMAGNPGRSPGPLKC